MKIQKGDKIIVIAGKDKGKKGTVIRAIPKDEKIVVEGVNIRKKHQKATREGAKGQMIEFAAPLHVSNVLIEDPKTKEASRVGYKVIGEKKVRIAKKSGAEL